MNTKEIAEAVGKDERTVQRWIRKTGDKVSSVGDKVSSAGHGKTADYTLEETCAIIEAGLGKNAADLYRMSANIQLPKNAEVSRLDRLENLVEKLVVAVAQIPAQIASISRPEQLALPYIQDYYTIKGYAAKIGLKQLTYSDAVKFGKEASSLSIQKGYEKRYADDEQYGQVGSYHIDVLKEVFEL